VNTLAAKLFAALRDGPLPLAEALAHCGTDRETLARELASLEALGYGVTRGETVGLHTKPDALIADEIAGLLRADSSVTGGWRPIVFKETGSTNDCAAREAAAGVPAGLAVFAEAQTAGRGRRGRVWQSKPGLGLWFSVLLDSGLLHHGPGRITASVAVAVAEAVETLCPEIRCGIKWPNDIWVGRRKIAGILAEAAATGGRVRYVIAGVGLNVAHGPEDFDEEVRETATSLAMETRGNPPRRAEVAAEILDRIATGLSQPFDAVRARWESRCLTIGREVEISTGHEILRGVVEAMDEEGCLLVRDANGLPFVVRSGEVLHAPVPE